VLVVEGERRVERGSGMVRLQFGRIRIASGELVLVGYILLVWC
jgi:hypothetical protein